MNKTNLVPYVLEKYQQGHRYFENLDIENESFEGQNLQDITFEGCSLYVSFKNANLKNAKFINGGIKTCDFRDADLTNAKFENVCIESAQFARSKTDNIYFDNNSSYGQLVTKAHFDEWIKDYEE
ncbi:pentapeptide repeat-containing protein [Soonwooa sp.]|uniref:pentapeptide repeat-containing protein n=1 Tax=Soonwooa sp. TaxID=1938592 RepID=UPI0028ABC794|nr:pentapeptide repeat-containing protein [Soonwooa sp.]